MDFLRISGKYFFITGISNKKSIAYSVAKTLIEHGAHLIISVQNQEIKEKMSTLFPTSPIFLFDATHREQLLPLQSFLKEEGIKLSGMLHSLAFARFENGEMPLLDQVKEENFFESIKISAFSFVDMAKALKDYLTPTASCVTVSISSTKVAAYGYLASIKSMLESFIPLLAKSFSLSSQVRFNAVCAGPLKTSASAGIPHYLENYLFSEKLTLRKEALHTQEVADTLCYLLSERSSGINGEKIVVDAGMSCNYFDEEIVKKSIS